jgi:hypothetical protein
MRKAESSYSHRNREAIIFFRFSFEEGTTTTRTTGTRRCDDRRTYSKSTEEALVDVSMKKSLLACFA